MTFLALKLSHAILILLINVKISTIVDILKFMSKINFTLSRVKHEKSFIISRNNIIVLSEIQNKLSEIQNKY